MLREHDESSVNDSRVSVFSQYGQIDASKPEKFPSREETGAPLAIFSPQRPSIIYIRPFTVQMKIPSIVTRSWCDNPDNPYNPDNLTRLGAVYYGVLRDLATPPRMALERSYKQLSDSNPVDR